MRKKTIYVLATVMCMSIFTACGSTNRADAGNEVQQEVQAEDNMQKEQQAGRRFRYGSGYAGRGDERHRSLVQ